MASKVIPRTLSRCCGSELVSMRIRIQGAKPMQLHAESDPSQTLKFKKIEFLYEKNCVCRVNNRSKNILTKYEGQKTYLQRYESLYKR